MQAFAAEKYSGGAIGRPAQWLAAHQSRPPPLNQCALDDSLWQFSQRRQISGEHHSIYAQHGIDSLAEALARRRFDEGAELAERPDARHLLAHHVPVVANCKAKHGKEVTAQVPR